MNRYSMIFALLVASSFVGHPTQTGNGAAGSVNARASAVERTKQPDDPTTLLEEFLKKSAKGSNPSQSLQVLFATVPHPVETHLAAAFDQDADALQSGMQESGYLFDSSWIPFVCVIVDAADNAEMFAEECRDGESFIRTLLREKLPPNVRLIALSRPERVILLKLPSTIISKKLREFSPGESRLHLQSRFPVATEADAVEFHRLTSANPRVQASILGISRRKLRLCIRNSLNKMHLPESLGIGADTSV